MFKQSLAKQTMLFIHTQCNRINKLNHMKRSFSIGFIYSLIGLLLISCGEQVSLPSALSPTPELPAMTVTPISVLINETQQPAKGPKNGNQKRNNDGYGQIGQTLDLTLPEQLIDVVLGVPSENSITMSIVANQDMKVNLEYTANGNQPNEQSLQLKKNEPYEVILANLEPDSTYSYMLNSVSSPLPLLEGNFVTQRASGSSFVFTVQADSHLDTNTDLTVYQQTITNEANDDPDFVIDLGDTFMTEKYKPYETALAQYQAQRSLLSSIGKQSYLFLVLGNHDGETNSRGNVDNEMVDWAFTQRSRLFPNPATGTTADKNNPQDYIKNRENYYSWQWGDALFIVLDPYTYTPEHRSGEPGGWNSTLGKEQYDWLSATLSQSEAKFKFVFIHQLVGGLGKDGRGGVSAAPLYEWGGFDTNGKYVFDTMRPGWGLPIHQLLVSQNVTAVFHGHDHLFVKEELDGITYQEVPQPGSVTINQTNSATEYGYDGSNIFGGPGYLRISVGSEKAQVDFIRTVAPLINGDSNYVRKEVEFSYSLSPSQSK